MARSVQLSPLDKENRSFALAMAFVVVISVIAYGWSAIWWAVPIAVLGFGLWLLRRWRKEGRNPSQS